MTDNGAQQDDGEKPAAQNWPILTVGLLVLAMGVLIFVIAEYVAGLVSDGKAGQWAITPFWLIAATLLISLGATFALHGLSPIDFKIAGKTKIFNVDVPAMAASGPAVAFSACLITLGSLFYFSGLYNINSHVTNYSQILQRSESYTNSENIRGRLDEMVRRLHSILIRDIAEGAEMGMEMLGINVRCGGGSRDSYTVRWRMRDEDGVAEPFYSNVVSAGQRSTPSAQPIIHALPIHSNPSSRVLPLILHENDEPVLEASLHWSEDNLLILTITPDEDGMSLISLCDSLRAPRTADPVGPSPRDPSSNPLLRDAARTADG